MAYDYGYGNLENELIDLLRSGEPDLNRAEELIRLGADLNSTGKDNNGNILSKMDCSPRNGQGKETPCCS